MNLGLEVWFCLKLCFILEADLNLWFFNGKEFEDRKLLEIVQLLWAKLELTVAWRYQK